MKTYGLAARGDAAGPQEGGAETREARDRGGMMSLGLTRTEPCKTCPYRKDAPLGLWHRSEFDNLRQQDADPINGHVFACSISGDAASRRSGSASS